MLLHYPRRLAGEPRRKPYALLPGILNSDVDHLLGAIRYQHTEAIRVRIAQSYKPATANKILSALRQTLKQAWLLGQMTAEGIQPRRLSWNLSQVKPSQLGVNCLW